MGFNVISANYNVISQEATLCVDNSRCDSTSTMMEYITKFMDDNDVHFEKVMGIDHGDEFKYYFTIDCRNLYKFTEAMKNQ